MDLFKFYKQGGQNSLQQMQKVIKDLPLPEKVKAFAIYKRYKQIAQIEKQMQAARTEIQKKYIKLDQPLLHNISEIVSGKRPLQDKQLQDLPKYLNEDQIKQVPQHLQARKIQGYWRKCLNALPLLKQRIGKDDEPLLDCIENIHVVDEIGTDNFTIHFTMRENEIIKNNQLTKKYYIQNGLPMKCESTVIDWVSKNLTLKQVKKKQKNKKTGQQRVVTKQVKNKSFFNFFINIDLIGTNTNLMELNEEDMAKRQQLDDDFDIGGMIVDQILPYSLEYFLGVSHEGDEDFGDDLQGEQNDDDDDDGQQKDKKKSKKQKDSKSKSKSKSKGKDKEKAKPEQKPECKQQ